jgi:hypothetical protein
MSLLDDVSIVVTPNGYKAGELYAVIPVPTEGAEEIPTPDFSSSTGWSFTNSGGSNGWVIDAGRAICDSSAATPYRNLNSTFSLVNGKSYRLIIDILQSADNMSIVIGSTTLAETLPTGTNLNYEYFIPESAHSGGAFSIYAGSSDLQEIDNVSVKEYTAADMDVTRATAATRVDENGLVNYAEVIGGEEIEDGNFPLPNTEWTLQSEWSIGTNKAIYDNSSSGNLVQSFTWQVGKTYKITFDIGDFTTNQRFDIYSGVSFIKTADTQNNTSYEIYFNGDGGSILRFRGLTTESFSLSNISIKEVTRDNVPRIDYTGGGCPHILAEPQRTNLLTYSEDFNNAIWTKSGSSVTPNATTSPDGTINADKLVEDTSTGGHQTQSITSSSNSTIYTTSVFVKYAGREWIRFTDAQSSNRIHFNTLTGVFGTISGTVIDYNSTALEDGWYKLSFTTTSVATAYTPRIALAEADNDVSYTGDGVSGVYIWGAQLELGSYPTSLIPTSGSTVTRNQDIFSRDGIGSLINSTEGVLYFEGSTLENGGSSHRLISLSDGTGNNLIYIRFDNTASRFRGFARGSSGSYTLITVNSVTQTDNNKIAVVWDATNFRIWINGSERATTTINDVPVGMNALNLADTNGTADPFFGKVKQLQVYKTALTDVQLAALTS